MQINDVKIDQDIEELLRCAAHSKRLILFNDNIHTMDQVVLQVMRARESAGSPCPQKEAIRIMQTAHRSGQAKVLCGDLQSLRKAQIVLESIRLGTDIID